MSEWVEKALRCLGKGFDVNSDFQLKYCKGKGEEEEEEGRLVALSPETADLAVPSFGAFPGVSVDVRCDKGERIRYQSGVVDFTQMSLLVNEKNALDGKIPSGLFNSSFGFAGGSWVQNASNTRSLAFDGYYISLFHLRLDRHPLALSDHVTKAIPRAWDPAALARFIEKYGTHVIVGLSIGGRDAVFVRQDRSSKLPPSELKEHLHNLGDQIFTGTCTISPLHFKKADANNHKKVPEAFDVFGPQPVIGDGSTKMSSKQGITVIWSKRGGDASAHSHCEWLPTVSSAPDAVNFTFMPITSLLTNALGKGFLSHAINLYLRYKPPLSDLERFLDFQIQKVWAPMHYDLPLGPYANRYPLKSSLRFSTMGPKLSVNTNQVMVGSTAVTGMRLYLEGRRNNRLAIHLQHLSTTPNFLLGRLDSTPPQWREATNDESFYEPVQSRRFSRVCTAAVEYDPVARSDAGPAFIVTGAQLHIDKHHGRRDLRLRLLYSSVLGHFVEQSTWEEGTSTSSGGSRRLSGFFSTLSSTISATFDKEKDNVQAPAVVADSGVFAGSPPVPVRKQRMLKFVDTRQVSRGASECPGHWLATGARLALDKGRVALHVKFSLLCPSS